MAASRGKPVPVCATGGRRRNASGHANDDRLQVRPSVDLLVAAAVFDWYGSLNSVRIRYAANQVAHWGISTALDIPCTRWPPRETPNLQYQLHTRPHMLIATVFSSPRLGLWIDQSGLKLRIILCVWACAVGANSRRTYNF